MDAFFASVEQRDNPLLKGKPVAVGGSSNRGVIAAASYEARKFGVYSAMPTATAMAKCPHLILVKANGNAYKEASQIIQSIFFDYTEMVEPLSLDEAFLDVTFNHYNNSSATLIAKEIKQRIKSETQLTASAGIQERGTGPAGVARYPPAHATVAATPAARTDRACAPAQ